MKIRKVNNVKTKIDNGIKSFKIRDDLHFLLLNVIIKF